MKRINITLDDETIEAIEQIKKQTSATTSAIIRRAIFDLSSKGSVSQETSDEETDESEFVPPTDFDRKVKEKAILNAGGNRKIIKNSSDLPPEIQRLTPEEAVSELNNTEPDPQKVKRQLLMRMGKTGRELEYLMTVEIDADCNPIYE